MRAPPLISVVIPCFDRAATIAAAVHSVLAQPYPELEVLVVDDHSSDQSAAVVRALGDPRVRVLGNARARGAQGARNTGILAARGDWIAFNDSDDEWLPGKLGSQVQALQQERFAENLVIHGNGVRMGKEGAARARLTLPRTEGDAYADLLLRPGPMLQGMLVRRSELQAIGLLDESLRSYQEWDTAIRLAQRCRFIHLVEPLFVYRVGHAGAISGDLRRDITGYASVVRKHAAGIVEHHGRAGLRRHYQWLLRRASQLDAQDLVAELRAEAVAAGNMTALRRGLLERSCAAGMGGSAAHRLAQLYDRLLPRS